MTLCKKPQKASEVEPCQQDKETVDPCPLADANIVSVAWWAENKEQATGNQWVNLPIDDKWVDETHVKHKDWLGRKPSLKVCFDKPGAHSFELKLLQPTGTTAYTDTEKGRNANFKYTETSLNFTTAGDGTLIIKEPFELVVGGGYEFIAQAKDAKGKTVKTGKLTTKRKFYYVEAKMTGLSSILSSTTPVDSEYKKHHCEAVKLDALAIPHQENIGSSTDSATLSSNIVSAINAEVSIKEKNKYLLVVAYTDHLAVKNSNVAIFKMGVNVGPEQANVEIPVTARGLRSPNAVATRYLWHDLVEGESWFVSAKFVKDSGGEVVIPQDKVSHGGNGNYWNKVVVDVTGLEAASGKVEVTINVVDRMRGGLALGGANQTCVCTRAWWRDSVGAKQECTIIHELGHKLGMVATGSGISPDKHDTHYENKGHVGNHCFSGCEAGQDSHAGSDNLAASNCVIFGSVNQKNAYCDNCQESAKKIDFSAGF